MPRPARHRPEWAVLVVAVAAGTAFGCACEDRDDGTEPPPDAGVDAEACPPEDRIVDGECRAPGQKDDGCPAGTSLLEDGSCRPAGVPAELCAEGFEPDGPDGCRPILPATPCAEGLVAVPGETECHEVAPCAPGTWGDIPVEPDTQYVDEAYAGGGSDGTSAAPWTTIAEAIEAADPGAIVAIAEGSYAEDLSIEGKSVRLWGRCPGLVEIVGRGRQLAALDVVDVGSDAVEVRDLAIRGASLGVTLSGSEGVLLDRVWIHETASAGVDAEDLLGPTRVHITRSLIERTRMVAIFLLGSEATVESTVVRDTRVNAADDTYGCGIDLQDDPGTARRSSLVLRGSVVERNHYVGLFAGGSDLTVEASVIRDTEQGAAASEFGRGIEVEDDRSSRERGRLVLRGSVVSGNHQLGVGVFGSDATIEATVVRDTLPAVDFAPTGGEGISIWDNHLTEERSSVTIADSLVAGNHQVGILAGGSDVRIERTVVRDTRPGQPSGIFGAGIQVGLDPTTLLEGTATVLSSIVENNRYVGIQLFGATGTIDGTVVRATAAQEAGGSYGDGIAVMAYAGSGLGTILQSLVEGSVRAGISNFGAGVTLSATRLECNTIHLDGEVAEATFTFDDLGGNACGCDPEPTTCQVLSTELVPPELAQAQQ